MSGAYKFIQNELDPDEPYSDAWWRRKNDEALRNRIAKYEEWEQQHPLEWPLKPKLPTGYPLGQRPLFHDMYDYDVNELKRALNEMYVCMQEMENEMEEMREQLDDYRSSER